MEQQEREQVETISAEIEPIYEPKRIAGSTHWVKAVYGDKTWPVYSITLDPELKALLDKVRAGLGKKTPPSFTGLVRYILRLGVAVLMADQEALEPGLQIGKRDVEILRWRHLREIGKAGGHTSAPDQSAVYTVDGWFAGYEVPGVFRDHELEQGFALVGWDGKVIAREFPRRARILLGKIIKDLAGAVGDTVTLTKARPGIGE